MKKQVEHERNSILNTVRLFLSGLAILTVGGLIGSSVALLYAPRSGRATRALIRSRGVEMREKIAEETHLTALQARDQMNHMRRDARYRAREIGSRLQNTRQDTQHALREAVSTVPLPFKHNGQ